MPSSWYAYKIAPDGVVEDACHPNSAEYLEAYLHESLKSSDAAYEITRHVASGSPIHEADCVANFWALLMDALMKLEVEDVRKIIVLLDAIQEVSEPNATAKASYLWPHLQGFGNLWGDELRKMQWPDLIHKRDLVHQADWSLERVRTAKAETTMAMAGVGNIPIAWG